MQRLLAFPYFKVALFSCLLGCADAHAQWRDFFSRDVLARQALLPGSAAACVRLALEAGRREVDRTIIRRRMSADFYSTYLVDRQNRAPVRRLPTDRAFRAWREQHRVYISATSSPQRISQFHYTLDTLDLSEVERVFVALPAVFARTGQAYEVPDFLSRAGVTVLRPPHDDGPATKIIPAARYLNTHDPDALLISIDDDKAYPRGMIHELIYAAYLAPRAAVGSAGQILGRYGISAPPTQRERLQRREVSGISYVATDLLEGRGAILYPIAQLPVVDIESMVGRCRECFISDDLVIGLALEAHSVPRYRIASEYYSAVQVRSLPHGEYADALQNTRVGAEDPATADLLAARYRNVYRVLGPSR